MKKVFTLLAFTLLTTAAFAQNPIKKFIRKHNNGPENVSITVPGWLIGLAGEVGMLAAEDEEERVVFSLAQSFGTTKILTFDSNDFATKKDIRELLGELETEHGYERWATVRAASGEQVELTVEMRGDAVKSIVALVHVEEEHQTFFAHAKTDFTAQELGDILNQLMEQ
ncbi:DUF4252 domain-containing protein [Neolewinella aurantiaca]|uniref:DUF4252 domain-containing protein n=1 Tax=Neolewinella aurantiaca TaxID=2602767 RepID=A0A5C7FSN3_9BACT|nr:DUF4252 domain-containing protein [Neolewinella aurantiaca]TXF89495.1 DUF4252 domain-containing protein [Neolewinella aurantiaca]